MIIYGGGEQTEEPDEVEIAQVSSPRDNTQNPKTKQSEVTQ